jgi:hypothetical protein
MTHGKNSYVGLFWFNRDYKDFNLRAGDVEFDESDIINNKSVQPKGNHKDYRVDYDILPRGRIMLDGGLISICIGAECPDLAIELVKKSYGLDKYSAKTVVNRDKFWDTKKAIDSSHGHIGLFWFKEDYSGLDTKVADRKFSVPDMLPGGWTVPKGEHRHYKTDYQSLPRGRIAIEDGRVVIYVGTECPDSAIEILIDEYGLHKYRNRLDVVRRPFWDRQ